MRPFEHLDDAGKVQHDGKKTIVINGKKALLLKSLENYNKLMALNDEHSKHFQKYLPVSMKMISESELQIELFEDAVSLTYLKQLEQKHVNWILSRMLEFVTWLNFNLNLVHCGINPDSVYVYPRTHGMVCISFYHITAADQKLASISGRYIYFYPSFNIVKKIALQNIDIMCAKKTAIYLMGDKTGLANEFEKDKVHYNERYVAYLKSEQHDTHQAFLEFRELLSHLYNTKVFHPLIVE